MQHFGSFVFFNDAATTEIYPLSLHDALPISVAPVQSAAVQRVSPSMSSLSGPVVTSQTPLPFRSQHAVPCGPGGPVSPVAPVAPVDPVGPVSPVAPVGPVSPVGPVDPVGPGAPGAPAA